MKAFCTKEEAVAAVKRAVDREFKPGGCTATDDVRWTVEDDDQRFIDAKVLTPDGVVIQSFVWVDGECVVNPLVWGETWEHFVESFGEVHEF